MVEKLSLTLAENSFDFLNSAVKYARGKEPRDWKYALLNLASALELMMKAVLEKEHWSLLFENIDAASREKFFKGEFQSVNFNTAMNRLTCIANLSLSVNDKKYLRNIRDKRNKITHFSIDVNIEEIKSIVARGLGLFIKFYKEIDSEDQVEDTLHYINSELREFQKYVRLRLAEIDGELKKAKRPDSPFLSCPLCLQETIIIHEKYDELFCKFCGAEFSYQDMAECSDGNGGPCPKCDNGALGYLAYNNEEGEFICTKCGFISDYCHNVECSSCGNIYWDENGGENYLCEACHKSIYD